jgi:antitoxin component YwqK of YwqJK toxin-antitoxin module
MEWVDIDKIWQEAADFESKGEYEDALAKINKIPSDDSSYISSLTSKSYYLINTEKYKEAIAVSEEGLKSKYQTFHYYFTLNKIAGLLGLEDYDKSLVALDEALKTYPKNHKLYYNKGVCYEGLKKYSKAAEMYQKSITYNPFYAKNHLRLAILCYDEHLITQAMMCLNMYLLCNPDGEGAFEILNSYNNMVKSKNDEKKHPGVSISKDDKSFEEIDLIINNYAALNKKYKIDNKILIPVIKQNHAMIGQLKDYEGNGGFWDKHYVPFYKWVDKNDLFNSFAYTIAFSVQNEKYKAIVNKNISKIKDFIPKYQKEWKRIAGENQEIIDGKKTTVQYLYNGAQIEGYGAYRENITVGKWIVFNGNGGIASEGTFDDEGKKHGKWNWYNKEGGISEQGEYEHGTLINEYLVYHDNGVLNIRAHYKEGKLEGNYKKYKTNGALIENLNYTDGEYDGEYLSYHDLGKGFIEYKIPYIKGKIEGEVIEYYADGKVKTKMNFKDNKKVGTSTVYYRNGEIDTKKEYVDGALTGDYEEYHYSGKLYQKGNYLDNNLTGDWQTYYDDATLATETFYVKGMADGIYKKYDRDGKIQNGYTYRKGEIIAYQFYNKKGEIIKEDKKKGGEFFYEGHAPNGNIINEGMYDISGGKEGEWKFYSENHVLETKQTLKENKLQGVSTNYHENGTIKNLTTYNNDTLEGYYSSFYINKQMYQQGWYHKGELSGEWLTYYADGKLKQRNYYTNGKSYGFSENYAGNGKLESKYFYFEDIIKKEYYYNPAGELIEEINIDVDSADYNLTNKFVTGKLSSSYQMRYNKRHGKFISNYFSGNRYCDGIYFNGDENGYWKWYHENGKLYKEGKYNHGSKDGVWKTYHENGKINKESTYLSGAAIGTEKTYNEQGVLTQSREFKSNTEHGELNFYSEALGKLQLTRHYNYGTLIGYSYLDKTGKKVPMIPITNETVKIEAYFDNGKPSRVMEVRNGNFVNTYKEYYYSGQIFEDQLYEDDERKGIIKSYFPDGKVMTEKEYFLGNLIGVSKEYYANGQLKEETEYANNAKNGFSKFYDASGKLIKEKSYFDGEVFSEKIYK